MYTVYKIFYFTALLYILSETRQTADTILCLLSFSFCYDRLYFTAGLKKLKNLVHPVAELQSPRL